MRNASVTLTDSVYSHYQIEDLGMALNTRHPLIFQALKSEDVFQSIKNMIGSVVPKNDERFEVQIRSDRITVKVV
jgi:hypothetical protein